MTHRRSIPVALMLAIGVAFGCATKPSAAPQEQSAPAGRVYILGNVNRPGVYDFQPKMTVGDLVLAAGGVRQKPNTTIVYSRQETGKSTPVELIDVLKADDVILASLKETPRAP